MQFRRFLRIIPRWLSTSVVTAAILYATILPHPPGAEQLPLFEGADKVIHFIMFGTLTAALLFDFRACRHNAPARRLMAGAGAISVVFGAVDELLQQWLTDNRSSELLDWCADIAGTVAALLIFAAVLRRHRREDHRPVCRG